MFLSSSTTTSISHLIKASSSNASTSSTLQPQSTTPTDNMKFTAPLIALLSVTGAVAAPAAEAVSMMAAGNQWTIQGLNRVCNAADTTCTWNFKIFPGSGTATACKYVVSGAGASQKNGGPTKCGNFQITSGWSGQFGPGNGFTTMSVVSTGKHIIYPAYTDKQLAGGKVVKPDQAYTPASLP